MATTISDVSNGSAKDGLLKNVYIDKKRKGKPNVRRLNKRPANRRS